MKKILTGSGLLAVALFAATACQTAASPTSISKIPSTPADSAKAPAQNHNGHDDDAPRISLADAKKDFDAGNAVFIDTRSADSYKAEHIKGAINISSETLEAKLKDIPKGKKLIVYCS